MAKRSRPGPGRAVQRQPRPSAAPEPAPVRSAGPPAEATAKLERGMVLLQQHDYAAAATVFRTLLEAYPRENALLDRARVYLDLCERELLTRPAPLRTAEERLTAATAALNSGDDARAERLVREVLASDPENDLALYLLAAVETRRGMADLALQYLSQAVAISPEAGLQARHDADFELLRGTELFEELTSPASSGDRPRRQGRAGR